MPVPASRFPPLTGDGDADLLSTLYALTDVELAALLDSLPPSDRQLVERTLAERHGQGWRANPATLLHHLDPATYDLWRYQMLLAEAFRRALTGLSPKQLWWMPSQMGKTELLLRGGVTWALDRDPRLRIMYVTFDDDKAAEEGRKTRDFIEQHADELRIRLRPDVRAKARWVTPEGGGLYCVGIHGSITGNPADVLLLDDLIKGFEVAHSEAQRNAVWRIYESQCRMRLQGFDCPIIGAGTRWHEDDPGGRFVKKMRADPAADQFEVIRIPAIYQPPTIEPGRVVDPILLQPDPLGRAPGEVIEPLRFDEREVRARRTTPYITAALEDQWPTPEEGDELLRSWWRLESTMPARCDAWLTSWDMKLKDKETGDYTVGQVWGRTGGDFWIFDQVRGQWPQSTTQVAMAWVQARYPQVVSHYVENAGYGPEVMETLRTGLPGYTLDPGVADVLGIPVEDRPAVERLLRRGMSGLIPVVPKGPKPVRARAVSPLLAAGNCHAPIGASWLDGLLSEMAAFPNGEHDDQVDTWSQALSKLRSIGGRASSPRPGQLPRSGRVAPGGGQRLPTSRLPR